MKEKTKKEKQGLARLFELAGARKKKLTLACLLSVLSSAARIVPFFTIYGVVVELLAHYTVPAEADQGKILALCAITFGAALVYGVCAYASSAISHTAAYEIIYELRLQLMEKLARISSGYFTGTTQGAIKKIVSDDSDQIEAFLAHHLCEIAAAIATPVFTLLYLFFMDWRLALVTLLPICISLWMLSSCLRQPDKEALQVELHDAQERMQGTVVEYIHGMSVVKVFNRTLSAFRRYEGDLNHFTDVVERTARANARPMGAYYAFFGAQLLFLLPAALLLIPTADSYLDFLPVILLFFLVGGGLKEPPENMMQMVILSSRILEGVRRMDNILRQPEPDQKGSGNPTAFDVEFSNVEFAYTKGIPAIEANIRMGKPDATMEEIIKAAKAAACHDFIMALPDGYQIIVGEGGSTLSGGEKQRISIARALLKDAPIVLLDEATASLDPENEVLIQQAISALVAEKTVIVIAHRLQSIMSADNILVLEDGRVAESGTHEQLLAAGRIYANLWAEQSRAASWGL